MKSNYKILLFYSISLLFYRFLYSDAGYLGSVSSGISPVLFGEDSIEVEMTSEDVIIVVSEDTGIYNADIVCSFVFTDRGASSDILMAFPLKIRTPFYPIHYLFIENDEIGSVDWRSQFSVRVDGETVLSEIVFVSMYNKNSNKGYEWNEFSDLLGVLNSEEPRDGEMVFYKNLVQLENYPILEVMAVLATWEVDFSENRQRFVEFRQIFELTSDYNEKVFRLTYPLFTGASWANSILDGRIAVVFEDEESAEALKYCCGSLLPEPTYHQNGYYAEPADGMLSEVESSENSKYYFKSYKKAVVWNFCDLEPIPTNFRFQSYYPDIGDIGAEYYAIKWDYGVDSLNIKEIPWSISYVYVVLASFFPESYYVYEINGCDFYSNPQMEGEPVFNAEMFSTVDLLERGEKTSKFRVRFPETGEIRTGWSVFYILNEKGLVKPLLVPSIKSYYEESI
ncbi:hypothetical protein JXA84_09445 [candidate division WOR-3 bacterium]|nr:hypothetical protein [candidate division WOR-3 bacterium]